MKQQKIHIRIWLLLLLLSFRVSFFSFLEEYFFINLDKISCVIIFDSVAKFSSKAILFSPFLSLGLDYRAAEILLRFELNCNSIFKFNQIVSTFFYWFLYLLFDMNSISSGNNGNLLTLNVDLCMLLWFHSISHFERL